MTLIDIRQQLELSLLTEGLDERAAGTVERGHASDLLSDVLAHAPEGGVLVTIQTHMNAVAVASHAGLKAIIFSAGRRPEASVIHKAQEEGILLYATKCPTFEAVGRLYALGIGGGHV